MGAGGPIEATIRSLDFIGPTLYGAGESEGVYTSPSTAGPWTTQNNGLDDPTKKAVRQVVANGADLYAATSAGLFRSSGGSGAWTQVGVGDTTRRLDQGGVQSIVFNSVSDIVVAIAGASPSGVMYSSGSGAHWDDKATGFPVAESVFSITKSSAGIIYAAASDGVFASTDQGRSWTRQATASRRASPSSASRSTPPARTTSMRRRRAASTAPTTAASRGRTPTAASRPPAARTRSCWRPRSAASSGRSTRSSARSPARGRPWTTATRGARCPPRRRAPPASSATASSSRSGSASARRV